MPSPQRALLAFLALVAVMSIASLGLGACGSSPAPIPTALPSPVREARTIAQPNGSIRIEAVSARVVPNQPYRFPVFTHWGFTANSFDFDGSFWSISDAPAAFAAQNGNPPAGIDNPTDQGLIVLTAQDRATWVARGGARLELTRGPNEVQVFGCD